MSRAIMILFGDVRVNQMNSRTVLAVREGEGGRHTARGGGEGPDDRRWDGTHGLVAKSHIVDSEDSSRQGQYC